MESLSKSSRWRRRPAAEKKKAGRPGCVLSVIRRHDKVIGRILQGYTENTARLKGGHYKVIGRTLQGHREDTTRLEGGHHKVIGRTLQGERKDTTRS